MLLFLFLPQQVYAHAFGASYTLPIPFWLYMYAGAAVLFLSFLLIGIFSSSDFTGNDFTERKLTSPLIRSLTSVQAVTMYKGLSLFFYLLTLLSGLIGEDLSAFNFNMTFFWIFFVIGFTYITFIVGNIWEVVNPWKISIELFEKFSQTNVTGRVRYPEKLQYYPAFVLYMIFIGIELFAATTPFSLSVLLLQYSFITWIAVFLFGKKAWFRYGEFFSVFFRIVGLSSTFYQKKNNTYLRIPFSGLLKEKTADFSLILFILFMLSSTAFDGFRETNTWYLFYWDVLKGLVNPIFGAMAGYQLYEIIGLILSPFVFLMLYFITLISMRLLVPSDHSLYKLGSLFVFSLIPIAVVYNITHYFTLLLIQGQVMIRLLSDPFGWGWNLLGTADFVPYARFLQASFVWHFQVVFILLGHVISVYVAHIIAVQVYKSTKKALLSQIPMLFLMITYTIIGLWILSQPIVTR